MALSLLAGTTAHLVLELGLACAYPLPTATHQLLQLLAQPLNSPLPPRLCLSQALRVGANWRSVIPALAKAVVLHKEEAQVAKVCAGILLCSTCCPGLLSAASVCHWMHQHAARDRPSLPATVPQARLDAAGAAATAAFHVCPNLALLIEAMLAHPPEQWEERCPLQPGEGVKTGGLAHSK